MSTKELTRPALPAGQARQKVWIVTTNGPMGAEVKGVFPNMVSAAAVLTTEFCVAVEMELGVDYTEVRKFLVITRDHPVPQMIDFSKYFGAPTSN